jgi:CheY-like chemotaxis protein
MFIKPINAVVAKVSGNLPLRIVLIVPFVLQIFAAVGLTGWLSLRNGQKAVNDVATQLRSEITAHIRSRLDAFIETPRLINQINEAAIRQRQVNPDDTKAMERYLFTQIQFFEYMTFISYGNNRGDYVTVNRRVDGGTLFKFDITVSVVDATSIETTRSTRRVIALEPNQQSYRILIVDDKQDNRQLLIKLLNPLGFELKEASNGTEAVKIWDSFEPHLIWMDMRMPVMDGYQATKRIKLTTKGQATAVIALTASVLEEERAVVLSAGCDDFMRKPFQEAEIFELMNKHIGVRYVYDEPTAHTGSTVSKTDIQNALNPEALATLPTEVLANLEHAASFAYMAEIDSYIDEIRSYNANLADALATLALDFEYGKIVTLIQQAKK